MDREAETASIHRRLFCGILVSTGLHYLVRNSEIRKGLKAKNFDPLNSLRLQ
jgi:hypothetical protein